jgi:hypothetical protein
MERKSLMRGIDVPEDKKSSRKSGGDTAIPPAKIAIIVGCFIVGGLGIAYNFGVFDSKPVINGKQVLPQGDPVTPEAQKRMDDRKKKLELPDASGQKPVIGAS